jgi:hypothetical protein
MSTITERLRLKVERWLDRLVTPDTRYICGGCDDRFQTRFAGAEHVLRCHPEYQGVVIYEKPDEVFPVTPAWRSTWTNRSSQTASWLPEDLLVGQPRPAVAYRVHADV